MFRTPYTGQVMNCSRYGVYCCVADIVPPGNGLMWRSRTDLGPLQVPGGDDRQGAVSSWSTPAASRVACGARDENRSRVALS